MLKRVQATTVKVKNINEKVARDSSTFLMLSRRGFFEEIHSKI